MQLALEQAKRATPTPNAFCVGCVIVNEQQLISTGFSRELPGNTHAEQCALMKLDKSNLHEELELYTTMEPCSIRLSGQVPCTDTILTFNRNRPQSPITKVYVGVGEPDDFVNCEGTRKLIDNGVQVIKLPGLEVECLHVARGS